MRPKCSIPDCTKPNWAHTWCAMHHGRWRKHGDPLYIRPTVTERFWLYVDVSEGTDACWPWLGALTKAGYGKFSAAHGHTVHAHRWWWEQVNGPIADGLVARHVCPTGSRRDCVNDAHVLPGTVQDNTDDREREGRTARGERGGAALHPDRLPHGDAHWTHRQPERLLRGDAHPARTNPERVARGEGHGRAKATWEIVREIRRRWQSGETQLALKQSYPALASQIWFIVHNRTWRE